MARPSVKAETAAQLIRKRILHGDHALTGIPSERDLAAEFGISRETLRKALRILSEEGLLLRRPNGRLDLADAERNVVQKRIVGFVRHSNPSHDHELWAEAVRSALEGHDCIVRTLTFEHYGDASIAAGIGGFCGIFFLPPASEIPGWLLSKMRNSTCKVVVLDQDATEAALPSVVMFPPLTERKLLDHLVALGHRRIDCINTQECDRVIEGRIEAWRSFISERNLTGQLHSLTEFRPTNSAYQLIKNRLLEGKPIGTALVCTTGPAALGAMRAFYDAGIKVGRDVSVCAVNDEGLGPYLIPSLTCLQSPPRAPYLEKAVNWILNGNWTGPLLIQPEDVPMLVGDSTGPVPATGSAQMVFGPAVGSPFK